MLDSREVTSDFLMREQSISFLECLTMDIPRVDLTSKQFRIQFIDDLSLSLLEKTLNAKFVSNELPNKVADNILDNFCALYNIDVIKRTKIESLRDTCIGENYYTIEDILRYKFKPNKVINCIKGVIPKRSLATLLYDLYCFKGLLLFDRKGKVYPLFDLNVNGKLIKSIFNYKDYSKLQKSLTQGNKFYITHISSLYEFKMSVLYSKFKWSNSVLIPEDFHIAYNRRLDKAVVGFDSEVCESKLQDNIPSVVIDTLMYSKKFVKDIQAFDILQIDDNPRDILGSFYVHLLLHHDILSKTLDLDVIHNMCKVFSKTCRITKAVLNHHMGDYNTDVNIEINEKGKKQIFGHIGKLDVRKLYSVSEDVYALTNIRNTTQLRVTTSDLYLYDLGEKRKIPIVDYKDFISKIQYSFNHANLILKLYTMYLQGYISKVYTVCKDLYKFNNINLFCIEEMNYCNGFKQS